MRIGRVGVQTVAIAFALGGVLAAQSSSPSNSASADDKNTKNDKKTITVTGCVQQGEQSVGTSGNKSSSNADRFMLTNSSMTTASVPSPASSTPPAATGAAGARSGSSTGSGISYQLEGKTTELRQHLNQQVEITGHIEASSSTTNSPARPEAGVAASATAPQRLDVESVRMIASSCSR